MRGDEDDPYTHFSPQQAYNYCRCCQCGVTRKCTPRTDFYCQGIPDGSTNTNQLLWCEACTMYPATPLH